MKIALCISGLPRNVKHCYPSINKYLIEPNNIEDIFIHTWVCKHKEDIGNINIKQIYKKSDTTFIQKKYKPKGYIEEFLGNILFEPNFIKEETINDNDYTCKTKNIVGLQCMFYSIYKSFELAFKYQEKNNFMYNAFIRLRFDMIFFAPIIIKDLDLNFLHVHDNYNSNEYPDEFAIGNYDNMKKYSEAWNNLQDILDKDIPYQNDTICSQNIKNYQIPVENLENIDNPLIRNTPSPKFCAYCSHPDSVKDWKDSIRRDRILKIYEEDPSISFRYAFMKL